MKKFILIGIVIALSGCSHAYIQSWSGDQVTACCPTKKIFCKDSALQDIANDRCGGSADAVSEDIRGSESYSGYAVGNYVNVSQDTQRCEVFQCGSRRLPASN